MKAKTKPRRKALTPPAHFLLSLAVESLAHYLIEHSRAQRATLAAMPAKEIGMNVYFQLLELASRIVEPKFSENAAEDLAMVGTMTATLLKELARTHKGPEIALAAARKNCWPVNLQLGSKHVHGKLCQTIDGVEKAKKYLVSIKLGEKPQRIAKHIQNPQANPFTRAAELLLISLYDQQEQPAQPARTRKNTWSNKLRSLERPVTSANVDQWWSVAKQWMDEQWVFNRAWFAPLVKHLKLDNPRFTPSTVKRQVIDDSLKKAFKALATRR